MQAGERTAFRVVKDQSVTLLLVVGALSGAAIFFQLTEHLGHAHAGLSPAQEAFATGVDSLGFVLTFMVAVQLMIGYRLLHFRPKVSRPTHIAMAWSIVGLMGLHMAGGIVHSLFQGPIEMLPVLADVIGIVSIAALAVSIPSGYLRAKDALGRARYVHTWLGITLAVVLAAHGLVGVLHTLSG